MSRFFFDDEETADFLEEYGVPISFVDASGSLRGMTNNPVHAIFDHETSLVREDLGSSFVFGPVDLTMKTENAKQLRTDTEITIYIEHAPDEIYRTTSSDIQTADGQLSIVQVERIR